MLNKKILLSIFFIIMIIFMSYQINAISTPPAFEQILKVAGDNNYPPYEFLDDNGNYKGFNVDIMRALGIELGLEIELIPMDWEDAIIALKSGKVDAIQGMTVTPDRESFFDFTQEIIQNSQSIFVLSSTSYISDLDDLEGKKVSIQADDVTKEILGDMPNIIVKEKVNQLEAIQSLLSGDVDAFIGNRITGIYYIQRFGLTESIKVVGYPIYNTQYSTAVKNDNTELLKLLDHGIGELKSNGTYDKIYKKWFGESFTNVDGQWKTLLGITLFILLILLIVLAFIYYWNKNLKHQVQIQTRELAQSNRFNEKVIDSIINGIVTFDESHRVIQSNNLACELLEKNIFEGESYEILVKHKIPDEALSYINSGDTWTKNLEWKYANGALKYVQCGLIPINAPNKIEGFILLINDRTKNIELYNLAKYNDKMKALGELSAGIAHELRNPLTSIKAFIDMIPNKIDDLHFRSELIKIVPKEVNRLDNLITSLLNYSKPKNPNPKIILLNDIFMDVLTLLKQKINEKNIKFNRKDTGLSIYADESQVKQILINIILNSIDAVDNNGIISIETISLPTKVSIIITDNGYGILKENLNSLFQPFYTSKKTGFGIGLSITDRLVRENKGDIKIESEEGSGTSVIINLPSQPTII